MRYLTSEIEFMYSSGMTYTEISHALGCSLSTVAYHLNKTTKGKVRAAVVRNSDSQTRSQKVSNFTSPGRNTSKSQRDKMRDYSRRAEGEAKFTFQDVIDKHGVETNCYLTGTPINLYETHSYHFDHITPSSKGGSNSLDNLGIATKRANMAKGDMSVEEFLDLCETVLRYHKRI